MNDLIQRLQQEVDGLLFPSESDSPLRVFVWPDDLPFSTENLLAYGGYDQQTLVKTSDLDTLFRPVTALRDWYGPEEIERARRFQALVDLLKAELSDIMVYEVGTVSIDVYVIGESADGRLLGLTTRLVET